MEDLMTSLHIDKSFFSTVEIPAYIQEIPVNTTRIITISLPNVTITEFTDEVIRLCGLPLDQSANIAYVLLSSTKAKDNRAGITIAISRNSSKANEGLLWSIGHNLNTAGAILIGTVKVTHVTLGENRGAAMIYWNKEAESRS